MALGIGFLPEDRKTLGLVLSMGGRANLSLPILDRLSRLGFVRTGPEKAMTRKYFDRLRVRTPHMDAPVWSLSGGNQQKIALAKWLASECGILLIDVVTFFLAMILAVAIGLPAAYSLSRFQFPGKKVVDTLLELPLIMSPVALGAALLVFFNTPFGDVIQERGILFIFEFPGIVLAQFATIAGLATRLMKTARSKKSMPVASMVPATLNVIPVRMTNPIQTRT
jgi:hypothetical protein